jgi:hypothetical protein
MEFYSGAAGLSGRFTEGFLHRRLHSTLADFAQILGVETEMLQDLIKRDIPVLNHPGCGVSKALRNDAPRTRVSAFRNQSPR